MDKKVKAKVPEAPVETPPEETPPEETPPKKTLAELKPGDEFELDGNKFKKSGRAQVIRMETAMVNKGEGEEEISYGVERLSMPEDTEI